MITAKEDMQEGNLCNKILALVSRRLAYQQYL